MEWPYLWEVLTRFGLGPKYLNWVRVLYSAPRARIRVNNDLSPSFQLHRGTRQGCPLSPPLLALPIEPLAILIHNSTSIVGFHRAEMEEKVCLYADDTLLYLEDTEGSLKGLDAAYH